MACHPELARDLARTVTSLRLPAQPGALIGRAADVARVQELLLREAIAGGIFAAGHGEVSNDLPVLLSTASAERVDGGYRFTGHKMFGSLTPVWTRLGVHVMDT